ncbi:MAG: hypothetical protein Q9226_007423 [Calogaya cf. arnoldii]
MSRYQADFLQRYPAEELPQNAGAYYRARRARYPNASGGFLGPDYVDGYDAVAAHDEIDLMKEPGKQNRKAYENRLRPAERFMNRLDDEQRGYYDVATGGLTPRDHYDLQPLARSYADSEIRHASAREDIYGRSPMMYGSVYGKEQHHGYIEDHYGHADYAEDQDPASADRDLYRRPVPAGFKPSDDPYPDEDPEYGYYSDKPRRAAPVGRGPRMNGREMRQQRRLR